MKHAMADSAAATATSRDVGGISPGRDVVATGFFVLLAFIAPLLIFGENSLRFWDGMLIGRIAILCYSAAVLAHLIHVRETRWFATAFWSFCYVWMGLAPLGQAMVGRGPYGTYITEATEFPSCELVLAGMAAWHIGYALFWSQRRHLEATKTAVNRSGGERSMRAASISKKRVVSVSLLAIWLTPFLLAVQGGLFSNWTTREGRSDELAEAGLGVASDGSILRTILPAVAVVLPFVACLIIVRYFQANPGVWRRPGWIALASGVAAVTLLSSSPTGSSRFWFGTVAIGLVTSLRPFNKPNGRAFVIISVIVSLVVIFPYADLFRRDQVSLQLKSISDPLQNKLDYDAASQITNGMIARDELGVSTNGRQMLGAALILVPRSIWHGKPETTGVIIAKSNDFSFTNMSSPLWIEGYMDFGVPGTLALLLLAGIASGALDRRYWFEIAWSRGSPTLIQVIVPPVAAYSYILLRGSLIGTLPSGVLLVALSVFVLRKGKTSTEISSSGVIPRCVSQ